MTQKICQVNQVHTAFWEGAMCLEGLVQHGPLRCTLVHGRV
jgi:hypothetical protein